MWGKEEGRRSGVSIFYQLPGTTPHFSLLNYESEKKVICWAFFFKKTLDIPRRLCYYITVPRNRPTDIEP